MATHQAGIHSRLGGSCLLLRSLVFLLFLPWISACHGESAIATNVVGYNHTDRDIGTSTIRIGNSEGGGGFTGAHQASGASCCVGVPDPWRPGLTAIVGWTDDHDENYQEREVQIPEYDSNRIAQVSVHFLRNSEIRVFVPAAGLGNPDYPLKGPEAGLYPGEDPVEVWKYGRKNREK